MSVFVIRHADGVELRASLETIEDAFGAAVALLARLLEGAQEAGGAECIPVLVVGASASALLGSFVEDLLVLADHDRLAVTGLERIRVEPREVRASVGVARAVAGAAGIRIDRAGLRRRAGRWRLNLSLDAPETPLLPTSLDIGF